MVSKNCIVLTHFKNFLFCVKELYFDDLKNQYEKFPICPYKDCPAMFKNKNLVEEHYKLVHKVSSLDWSNSNFMNKCQTCFKGPFPTFKHLVKHLGEEHEASIETYLKRRFIELQSTLLPVKNLMPAQNVTKANNCDVCSKSFKSTQILKVHMKKFHGISSKPKKEDDDINE